MNAPRPSLPETLLLDYAAGAASPGIALLLSTHLVMSEESRALLAMMESLGGALLEDIEGEPLECISAGGALERAAADEGGPVFDPWPENSGPTEAGWMKGAPLTFDQPPDPLLAVDAEGDGASRWRWLGCRPVRTPRPRTASAH